ncbi:hypothetical protein pb186bvf_011202 [Paramecium bursaria]
MIKQEEREVIVIDDKTEIPEQFLLKNKRISQNQQSQEECIEIYREDCYICQDPNSIPVPESASKTQFRCKQCQKFICKYHYQCIFLYQALEIQWNSICHPAGEKRKIICPDCSKYFQITIRLYKYGSDHFCTKIKIKRR